MLQQARSLELTAAQEQVNAMKALVREHAAQAEATQETASKLQAAYDAQAAECAALTAREADWKGDRRFLEVGVARATRACGSGATSA